MKQIKLSKVSSSERIAVNATYNGVVGDLTFGKSNDEPFSISIWEKDPSHNLEVLLDEIEYIIEHKGKLPPHGGL